MSLKMMLVTLVVHHSCGVVLVVLNLGLERCDWGRGVVPWVPFLIIDFKSLFDPFTCWLAVGMLHPYWDYDCTVGTETICEDPLDSRLVLCVLVVWFHWLYNYLILSALFEWWWWHTLHCLFIFTDYGAIPTHALI